MSIIYKIETVYRIIILCLLVLLSSCQTVKTIRFYDKEFNNLPEKFLDIDYGYSLNMHLNTNIRINPSKSTISKTKFPKNIIINKLRYLASINEGNVLVGIEVVNNKKSNAINKFYSLKQIQIIDSIPIYSYTLSDKHLQYYVKDYISNIENNNFLKISFISFTNHEFENYPYLINYASEIIKSLKLNYLSSERKKIEENVFGYMFDSYNYRGNYFQSLFLLDSLIINNTDLLSVSILYNSICGNYIPYLKSLQTKAKDQSLNKINYVDVHQFLSSIDSNYNILLFNENHNDPYCRFLLKNLLPRLKKLGFTHLGLEALSYIPHDINTFGFPVHGSGIYTDEPQMANLIREAHKLGFKIFPYEAFSWECTDCITEIEKRQYRETMQAENILAELNKSPNPKCIILAGLGHIAKQNNNSDLKMMAQELLNKSNYRILSINQTDQEYYSVSDKLPRMDCVPITQTGNCFLDESLQGKVDLQIIHNGSFHYSSDFNFNQIIGSDTIVNIPLHYLNKNEGYLTISSKQENDEFLERAVPYTNIKIERGIPDIQIKLDKGINYIISEFNIYGYPIYSSLYLF